MLENNLTEFMSLYLTITRLKKKGYIRKLTNLLHDLLATCNFIFYQKTNHEKSNRNYSKRLSGRQNKEIMKY